MQNVEIVRTWAFPTKDEKFIRTSESNPYFYILILQAGRKRFLKVGTSENNIRYRLAKADYKKYSSMKILFVAELLSNKEDRKNVCYHVEDLTRSAIREMKGFRFVKNDRFTYFQLPAQLPIFTSFFNSFLIETKQKTN